MAAPLLYLVPIDLNQNPVNNVVIQNLASPPGSPVEGQIYFDTNFDLLGVWSGSAWTYWSVATVTSVSLSLPSIFSTSGSPVTTSGTLTATLQTQTENTVFAGPTTGAAAAPTFRALVAADLSAVTSYTLDQFTAAAANVSLNSHKITNLANGTANTDAATYGQLLTMVNGLTWKDSVQCLVKYNIPLSGEQTIDGINTSASRVGVVGQATASQNGLYLTGSGAWVRTVDLATGASAAGTAFFVDDGGTTYGNTQWQCQALLGADVVGTNSLTFAQFGAGSAYSADGTTLTLTGSTFSINLSYVGQTSITTLGTIATGTWAGTTVAVLHGGTGATTASGARTNLGAVGKYSATIGDGSSTSIAITQATHGLATNGQMIAEVYDATSGNRVVCDISIANGTGTVTFGFSVAPASNAYRVVIMG
jgi:hypothetical protein